MTEPSAVPSTNAAQDAATSDVSAKASRHSMSPVAATFWLAVAVFFATDLTLEYGRHVWASDLLPFLLLAQVGIAVFVRWKFGRSRSVAQWLAMVMLHAALFCVPILVITGHYFWWRLPVLEAMFRLFLAALWGLPGIGLLLLLETVRRGRLRWRTWVPAVLRLCLAATVLLTALEGCAWLILQQRQPTSLLSASLPAARDDVFRIAAVGGSTMRGFPYAPESGIAEVAVSQLQQAFPERTFELQNLAVTGVNLQQAIQKIHDLQMRPNVLIVYSGHNQFFHNLEELALDRRTAWKVDPVFRLSPTFQLLGPLLAQKSMAFADVHGQAGFCGHKLCSDYLERKRLQRYRQQLSDLMQWANAAQVTVVHCVPASDEASFAPNQSWCRTNDPQQRKQLEDTWHRVRRLHEQQDWAAALALCQTVLEREPAFAEFHYLAGRSCRNMGEPHWPQARQFFEQARDLDQFPIRARSDYCEAGREVAMNFGAVIIDSPAVLRAVTPDGFLDDRRFLDGVHPNLHSCFVLGLEVAKAVAESSALAVTKTEKAWLTYDACLQQQGVTADLLARVCRTTADVLQRYALLRTAPDNDRRQAAARLLEYADGLAAGRVLPGQHGIDALTADPPPAEP